MKMLYFLLSPAIVLSCSSAAQVDLPGTAKPPVVVLKQSWELERLTVNGQVVRETQMTVPAGMGTALPRRPSRTIIAIPQPATIEPATTGRNEQSAPRERYHYMMTLRNLSEKAIRSVHWDYIFSDPDTKTEITHLRFASKINIDPGKSKQLDALTFKHPTSTASLRELKRNHKTVAAETIEVVRILYADGTAWHR